MNFRRAAYAAAALPLIAVTAACGGDDDDAADTTTTVEADDLAGESITVYSGRNEELVQPLIDRFEDETGITVEVRYGNSAEMGAQLLEEGDSTPADVFFSQEVGTLGVLSTADLLGELPDEIVELVDERFRPGDDNDWVAVTGRSRVIVYNKDLVPTPPAGVLDLTEPEYEGKVAWVPSNAGFQAFISGFRVSEGEAAAKAWLEGMVANGVQTYEGNEDVLNAVDSGTLPIGLINHYYWARTLDELGGADARAAALVFPKGDDPGALVNATAVGVTNKGEDNAAALAFVEFLLSEEGQTYFAEETFEYPMIDGVPDPEGIPALEELEGPQLDLTDLESLEATQALLTELGLLS